MNFAEAHAAAEAWRAHEAELVPLMVLRICRQLAEDAGLPWREESA